VSQQKRKHIEEIFGWVKTICLLRQTRHRGRLRVGWMFVFSLAVYNLVRVCNLVEQAPCVVRSTKGWSARWRHESQSWPWLRRRHFFMAADCNPFTRFFRSLLVS